MRRLFACTFLLLFAACPSDRVAQNVLHGSPRDARPSLAAPAPTAVATITKLRKPESVLHDPEQDVYFISNLDGGLLDADAKGFISRVDAATMHTTLKWIDSGTNGVRLDAPKGMAIVGNTLYVSDIGCVRKFDRRTGRPLGAIAIPGATLVNDLATDGRVIYASDTGVKPGPGVTFLPTGTDALWKIENDRATKIASGPQLNHPNGLAVVDGTLFVASFEGSEVYSLDGDSKKEVALMPAPQLDGIAHAGKELFVASWTGDNIFRGTPGGKFTPVLAGIDSPADIGYDGKRNRLLVPRTGTNQVTVHALD